MFQILFLCAVTPQIATAQKLPGVESDLLHSNTGISSSFGTNGFMVGGETSLSYLFLKNDSLRFLHMGAYIDAHFATRDDALRLSFGPQIGWLFFGVDGGLATQSGELGWAARLFVSSGFIGGFVRAISIDAFEFEAGVLLKWPLQLFPRFEFAKP